MQRANGNEIAQDVNDRIDPHTRSSTQYCRSNALCGLGVFCGHRLTPIVAVYEFGQAEQRAGPDDPAVQQPGDGSPYYYFLKKFTPAGVLSDVRRFRVTE
jgi:hypothetical protein